MRRAARAAAILAAAVALGACSAGRTPAASPSPSAPASGSRGASPSRSSPPLVDGTPRLVPVGTFDSPVYVTSPPGDPRLFVVEQPGRVRVVRSGRVLAAPFLDIHDDVASGGERGLLSIAFAPDYLSSGLFYVDYTNRSGDTRVAEYHVSSDPDRADPASRRELLAVAQPYANHNGGLLLFDPSGRLLVGLGDGGSAGDPGRRAQNLGVLLGKILRIDPRPAGGRPYGIPADNPFVHRAGARPEIWAYGLRNPWRFAFDPDTGDLYLADVGQNAVEEVNVVPPARQSGANYGWPVFEGGSRYSTSAPLTRAGPLVAPVHTYGHDGKRCSVTGGVVYGGRLRVLHGRYLFGDYCTGEVWSFAAGLGNGPDVARAPFTAESLSSFGVDAAGEAYVVSTAGRVWRISV